MAYDEVLAARAQALLRRRKGFGEKRMFGGLCFLIHGNMACGVSSQGLMVRVGPEAYEACLEEPHAREMDFTGRPMKGFVFVDRPGTSTDAQLKSWLDRGVKFARGLPAKD